MTGRLAGALYFLSAVAAGTPIVFVTTNLILSGDAAATARRILASEFAFRACIVSELCGAVLLLFTVRALYRLLKNVDERTASLMVTGLSLEARRSPRASHDAASP